MTRNTYIENPVAVDIVREYRHRALMRLGAITVPFVTPFAVLSLFQERYLIGSLGLFIVTMTLVNSIRIHRGHKPPIPVQLLFVMIMICLLHGMIQIDPLIAVWAYPVTVLLHFVTTRHQARWMSIIFFLLIIPAALHNMGTNLGLRFIATLILTNYFAVMLVRIIIELQTKLTNLAIIDPLTGVYNRRHMEDSLQSAIERTKRGYGKTSLIALDIDHFKKVNDTLGHDIGDKVICEIVDTVKSRLRKLDYIFRSGGEEFTIILSNTPLTNALAIAEDLRQRVADAKILESRRVTISLGVAQYEPGETRESWCKRADTHLYEAKQDGRNLVRPEIKL